MCFGHYKINSSQLNLQCCWLVRDPWSSKGLRCSQWQMGIIGLKFQWQWVLIKVFLLGPATIFKHLLVVSSKNVFSNKAPLPPLTTKTFFSSTTTYVVHKKTFSPEAPSPYKNDHAFKSENNTTRIQNELPKNKASPHFCNRCVHAFCKIMYDILFSMHSKLIFCFCFAIWNNFFPITILADFVKLLTTHPIL